MIDKVRATIKKYDMINDGDVITVGLSGGADSVCLFHVLNELKNELGFELRAAHINHGIRGAEADSDEDFVSRLCKEYDVPLTVFKENIPLESKKSGESEEECGRRIRYERFSSLGGKIATAHNLTDSIETTMFNIVRGSSLKGACGIPAVRDNIIRPLIECSGEEIRTYCRENRFEFVVDSTNLETEYTRNYIRQEILPKLGRINFGYAEALSRFQASARRDNAFLEKTAEEYLDKILTENGLNCSELKELADAILYRVIALYIKYNSKIDLEFRHIEFIADHLESDFELQLSSDFFVRSKRGYLSVIKKSKNNSEKFCFDLKIGVNKTPMGNIEISVSDINEIKFNKKDTGNVFVCNIDYDKINKHTAVIRSRNDGDEITLAKRGVTKSLKKLYNEMKIPTEIRSSIPIIADDEKVIWVFSAGYNKKCEISQSTKKIMTIKVEDNHVKRY